MGARISEQKFDEKDIYPDFKYLFTDYVLITVGKRQQLYWRNLVDFETT